MLRFIKPMFAHFFKTFGFTTEKDEPKRELNLDKLDDHDLLYFTSIILETSEYEVLRLAESYWKGELAPGVSHKFDLDPFYGRFLNYQVSLPMFVRDYARKVLRARHNKDEETISILKGELIA